MMELIREIENVLYNAAQSETLKMRGKDWLYQNVDRILAALTRAASPSEWQPIESAPKDGTKIDIWCCGKGNPLTLRLTDAYWDNRWMFDAGDEWRGIDTLYWQPTHWMPLPASPPNNHNREGA